MSSWRGNRHFVGDTCCAPAGLSCEQYSAWWAANEPCGTEDTSCYEGDSQNDTGGADGSPAGSYGNVTGQDSQANPMGALSNWANDVVGWFTGGGSSAAPASGAPGSGAPASGAPASGAPPGSAAGSAAGGSASSMLPMLLIGGGALALLLAVAS